MQKLSFKSFGLRAACALAALALITLQASSVAFAQPAPEGGGGEDPLNRPTATPPPAATPAATPAPAAPDPTASPAAPAAPATGGPKDNGLVFQFKFGGNFMGISAGGPTGGGSYGVWLNGGFMVGYKMGRLTLGLGIEVAHSDYSATGGPIDDKRSDATVAFIPTIEFYLLQSNPLALYLTAGLAAGFVNTHQDPGEDNTDGGVGFHVGLGMRYFLHPRFAIGVEGGFRGMWLFVKNGDGSADDETFGILAFYGAAVLTAIW